MFKDSPEGQTNYCPHIKDGTICNKCLGFEPKETLEWANKFEKTKFAKGGGSCFECCDYEEMYQELKLFIADLLAQQKAEYKLAKQAPMGVSQWRNHGEKYQYDKFWEDRARSEIKKEVEKICSDTFSGATPREHKELNEFYEKLEKI